MYITEFFETWWLRPLKIQFNFSTSEMEKQSAVTTRHCHIPRITLKPQKTIISLICTRCWVESVGKQEDYPWRNVCCKFFSGNRHIWSRRQTLFSCLKQVIWVICIKTGGTCWCNYEHNGKSSLLLHFEFFMPFWHYCGASGLCLYPWSFNNHYSWF